MIPRAWKEGGWVDATGSEEAGRTGLEGEGHAWRATETRREMEPEA